MTCPYRKVCPVYEFAERSAEKVESFKKILDFCEHEYPTCRVKSWLDGIKFWFWITMILVFTLGWVIGRMIP